MNNSNFNGSTSISKYLKINDDIAEDDNIDHPDDNSILIKYIEKYNQLIADNELAINILKQPYQQRAKQDHQTIQKILTQTNFFETILDPKINFENFFYSIMPFLMLEVFPKGTIIQNIGENLDKFALILKGTVAKFEQKTNREIEKEVQDLKFNKASLRSSIIPRKKKTIVTSTIKKEHLNGNMNTKDDEKQLKSQSDINDFNINARIEKTKTVIIKLDSETEIAGTNSIEKYPSIGNSPVLKSPVSNPSSSFNDHFFESPGYQEYKYNHGKKELLIDYKKDAFKLWHNCSTKVDSFKEAAALSSRPPIETMKFIKRISVGEYFGEQFHRIHRPKNIAYLATSDLHIMTINRDEFINTEQMLINAGTEKIIFFTSIFPSWPQDKLIQFSKYFHESELKKNSILFSENDPANALYIVKSGEVILHKHIKDYDKPFEDDDLINSLILTNSENNNKPHVNQKPSLSLNLKDDLKMKKDKKLMLKITSIINGQSFGEEPLISLKKRKFIAQSSDSGAILYYLDETDISHVTTLFGDLIEAFYDEVYNRFKWRYSRVCELLKQHKTGQNENEILNILNKIRNQMTQKNLSSLKSTIKYPELINSPSYEHAVPFIKKNIQYDFLSKSSMINSSSLNAICNSNTTKNNNSKSLRNSISDHINSDVASSLNISNKEALLHFNYNSGNSGNDNQLDNSYGILPSTDLNTQNKSGANSGESNTIQKDHNGATLKHGMYDEDGQSNIGTKGEKSKNKISRIRITKSEIKPTEIVFSEIDERNKYLGTGKSLAIDIKTMSLNEHVNNIHGTNKYHNSRCVDKHQNCFSQENHTDSNKYSNIGSSEKLNKFDDSEKDNNIVSLDKLGKNDNQYTCKHKSMSPLPKIDKYDSLLYLENIKRNYDNSTPLNDPHSQLKLPNIDKNLDKISPLKININSHLYTDIPISINTPINNQKNSRNFLYGSRSKDSSLENSYDLENSALNMYNIKKKLKNFLQSQKALESNACTITTAINESDNNNVPFNNHNIMSLLNLYKKHDEILQNKHIRHSHSTSKISSPTPDFSKSLKKSNEVYRKHQDHFFSNDNFNINGLSPKEGFISNFSTPRKDDNLYITNNIVDNIIDSNNPSSSKLTNEGLHILPQLNLNRKIKITYSKTKNKNKGIKSSID